MIRSSKKRNDAENFLREVLTHGPIRPSDLFSKAHEAGINRHILEKVKKAHSKAVQQSDGWWIHPIGDDQISTEQLGLFDSPTIPSWLTPDEVIWWVENNPQLASNAMLRQVAEASNYLNESAIIIAHEDALLSVEQLIQDLLGMHRESTTKEFAEAILAAIKAIKNEGPDSLSTE